MYLKIFTFFFCTIAASDVIAQSPTMVGSDLTDHVLIQDTKQASRQFEVEGSPFFPEEFLPGEIYSFQGRYKGILLRYDAFNDNFQFKQNEVVYLLFPEPHIKRISLGNEVFVVEKHEIKGKVKFGYLLRLDSGKLTLLAKKIVIFTERREAKALESSGTPARFTKANDVFYYKLSSGDVVKISSLKNLIEALPNEKNDEMAEYAKKERISPRSKADLLKLVKYYNSLQ